MNISESTYQTEALYIEMAEDVEKTERVIHALQTSRAALIHTSTIATATDLDVHTTGMILTRLYREGKVVRFFPRKTNTLDEKLWTWRGPTNK